MYLYVRVDFDFRGGGTPVGGRIFTRNSNYYTELLGFRVFVWAGGESDSSIKFGIRYIIIFLISFSYFAN